MLLVDLVRKETGAELAQIMLLRHFNSIERFLELGGSVEEYTKLQPKDTKWDYWRDGETRINIVVSIVRDFEYGNDVISAVYRVLGVEREGTLDELGTDTLRQFRNEIGLDNFEGFPRRLFKLTQIFRTATGATITGWRGKEIATPLRSNSGFFRKIKVEFADRDSSPRMT